MIKKNIGTKINLRKKKYKEEITKRTIKKYIKKTKKIKNGLNKEWVKKVS